MGGNHLWLPISSENGLTAQVVGRYSHLQTNTFGFY
jgi:hypothetical protein